MSDPLLQTKLHIPLLRPSLVSRPRLIKKLDAGLNGKLTLISAPAGFGKTTLVAAWLEQLAMAHCCWLSLEEEDNDPVRFLAYVVAALQRTVAGIGETAMALLRSPQPPPVDSVLTLLINDLNQRDDEVIFVLDDYHVINTPAVHEALSFLLDHQPRQLHLVIIVRSDPPLPLSRYRARDEMAEVRASDLRFTAKETAEFLNRVMALNLSREDVAALETRTEGWIAGLQLAALSLHGRNDAPTFIENFSGSHRYIIDYLVAEVLDRQPQEIRRFLLQTSILDRLCGPLCDAILSREAGEKASRGEQAFPTSSQRVLERLDESNVFIIPLDDERRWYRYHQLFADVLGQRLRQSQPALIPELHRRAAAWFEDNGYTAEAVNHAVAGQDWERAVRLVEDAAPAAFRRGEVITLLGWLAALPEELLRSRPVLSLAQAWALLLVGQLDAIETHLQDVEAALRLAPSAEGDRVQALLGHVATIRGELACSRGDVSRAVEFSRRALALLPEDDLFVRGLAAVNVALNFDQAYSTEAEVARAHDVLAAAARASQAAGQLQGAMAAVRLAAQLETAQGQLHRAAETYRRVLEPVSAAGQQPLPFSGTAYVGLGELSYEWNDLDAAQRYLQQGIELGELAEDARTLVPGYVALAHLSQAQADVTAAGQLLLKAEELAQASNISWLITQVVAGRVRLWLAQGNLARAGQWARESGLNAGDEIGYQRQGEYLALARVLLALGEHKRALDLLAWLLEVFQQAGLLGYVIKALILQALALSQAPVLGSGDEEQALAAFGQALELAKREGYVRTFVDEGPPLAQLLRRAVALSISPGYAAELLDAFTRDEDEPAVSHSAFIMQPSVKQPSVAHDLVESLTERELQVLQLIAAGLTNREIAEELVIVVGTVKGHINKIYRKLDVSNRVQAVSRARELGLL